jgi:hypothetical protein
MFCVTTVAPISRHDEAMSVSLTKAIFLLFKVRLAESHLDEFYTPVADLDIRSADLLIGPSECTGDGGEGDQLRAEHRGQRA